MKKIFDGLTVKTFYNDDSKGLILWRFIICSHGKYINGEYALRRA
jgi:hypothetical protein